MNSVTHCWRDAIPWKCASLASIRGSWPSMEILRDFVECLQVVDDDFSE